MEDHDQRLKTILREFFAEFMHLFFEEWAEDLDLPAVEWLDQEAFPDPPDGPRRLLDLVAKVNLLRPIDDYAGPLLALVHIEIESAQSTTDIRRRMSRYHVALRDRYDLPVLPIVVLLKVGLNGIGIESYVEMFKSLKVAEFQFLYVGLPALDGLQYVQGESYLGTALAALMKIPRERITWLGAEALRRLNESPLTEKQKFLLTECVQAYLPMDDELRREFDQVLAAEPYKGVRAMNKTVHELGIEKGIEKGQREVVLRLLRKRFGTIPREVLMRVEAAPSDRLLSLAEAVNDAASFKELGLADGG
jgi:hypothetical protein